jgi:hypothetical protein
MNSAGELLADPQEALGVVIQYEVHFEHKDNAIETITQRLEKDGSWIVGPAESEGTICNFQTPIVRLDIAL